jgi:hypothetical protein
MQRRRGEKIERNFAHQFDTGGMDRLYVRGIENVHKKLLDSSGGFEAARIENLSASFLLGTRLRFVFSGENDANLLRAGRRMDIKEYQLLAENRERVFVSDAFLSSG